MIFFHRKNKLDEFEDLLGVWQWQFEKKFGWSQWLVLVLAVLFVTVLIVLAPIGYQAIGAADNILTVVKIQDQVAKFTAQGDWQRASQASRQALEELGQFSSRLHGLGLVNYFPPAQNKINQLDKLLAGGTKLLRGYGRLFLILDEQDAKLGAEDFFQKISERRSDILSIQSDIIEAQNILAEVNLKYLSGLFNFDLFNIQLSLEQTAKDSGSLVPLLADLSELLGYQQPKKYLLVFQNNMEMRPTGGFIGSYGIATVSKGKIVDIFIDDVYNLDRFAEGKLDILAPAPMLKYNNQKYWYLRDANWSPDWPTAARQIVWFYRQEAPFSGRPDIDFDGVIALTPQVIADLLALTGPITARDTEFSADNFAWELERFVEFDYRQQGIGKYERKDIIGELAKLVLEKIYDLPAVDMLKALAILQDSLKQKHILVYLFDDNLQKQFEDNNWSGAMRQTKGDYLMVVDSNLAALKTDQAMAKSIKYSLRLDERGDLIGRLELTYEHRQPHQRDLISRYRDYLRIYVPENAWFLNGYYIEGSKEQQINFDRETEIGSELDKKYLALFFTVEPLTTKRIVLEYRLPPSIKNSYLDGLYKFVVQKQAGTVGHNLQIDLNFTNQIKSYHTSVLPENFWGQAINWRTDLSIDREFLIDFNN